MYLVQLHLRHFFCCCGSLLTLSLGPGSRGMLILDRLRTMKYIGKKKYLSIYCFPELRRRLEGGKGLKPFFIFCLLTSIVSFSGEELRSQNSDRKYISGPNSEIRKYFPFPIFENKIFFRSLFWKSLFFFAPLF